MGCTIGVTQNLALWKSRLMPLSHTTVECHVLADCSLGVAASLMHGRSLSPSLATARTWQNGWLLIGLSSRWSLSVVSSVNFSTSNLPLRLSSMVRPYCSPTIWESFGARRLSRMVLRSISRQNSIKYATVRTLGQSSRRTCPARRTKLTLSRRKRTRLRSRHSWIDTSRRFLGTDLSWFTSTSTTSTSVGLLNGRAHWHHH